MVFTTYADSEGLDQTAHSRSLIRAFAIRFIDTLNDEEWRLCYDGAECGDLF